MGAQESKPSPPPAAVAVADRSAPSPNLASDLKPRGEAAEKVKPCCVCKTEKQARDECMLFSTASDPQGECVSKVEEYRRCMRGYGFDTPEVART